MATFVKHVAKDGSITWKVKVRRNGHPSRTKTFASKAEGAAWACAVEPEIDRGVSPLNQLAEKVRLREALERYRDEVAAHHRGAREEVWRIDRFLLLPMADLPLARLTPNVLAAWRDERLKTIRAGTLLREVGILRLAIRHARIEMAIELRECPLSRIRRPRSPNGRERRLSTEEERILIEGSKRCRNRFVTPIIQFALETAIRQGEIISLFRDNIDLERRTAYLPLTKNGSARRVLLSKRAVEIIETLPRARFIKEEKAMAPSEEREGRVFSGLTTLGIRHAFSDLTTRIGMDDLHFHDLRHEAVSRLVERGLSILEVAAISGHKTLNQLPRYTHLPAEDIKAALRAGQIVRLERVRHFC